MVVSYILSKNKRYPRLCRLFKNNNTYNKLGGQIILENSEVVPYNQQQVGSICVFHD